MMFENPPAMESPLPYSSRSFFSDTPTWASSAMNNAMSMMSMSEKYHNMSMSESEAQEPWQSNSGGRKDSEALHNIDAAHRALYERVEASVSFGFAAIQRALVDLQLQLQIKLRQLMEQQELILQTQSPSADAIAEFEENVKKIDRSLESFTSHADNLSHIKLTLARAAAFVSPEGNLAQLVTQAQPKRRPEMTWQQPEVPTASLSGLSFTGDSSTAVYTGPMTSTSYAPSRHSRISSDDMSFGSSSSQGYRSDRLERFPERNFEQRERHMERNFDRSLDGSFGLDRLHINSSSNRIPNSTCFVFYLPPTATNETLRQLFMRYGTVLNAYVAMDKVTNRTRGFGFVDFSTPSEAQAAVQGLDKYPLEGKFLSVSIKV